LKLALKVVTCVCAEELDLGKHPLNNSHVALLASFLNKNASLKKLNLRRAAITNEGLTYLADALKHNLALEIIDISRNGLTD